MRGFVKLIFVCGLTLGFSTSAWSIDILKKEPGRGQLKAGNSVYVDDGTCPAGQVSQVSAGAGSGDSGNAHKSAPRTRRCVPRPY